MIFLKKYVIIYIEKNFEIKNKNLIFYKIYDIIYIQKKKKINFEIKEGTHNEQEAN